MDYFLIYFCYSPPLNLLSPVWQWHSGKSLQAFSETYWLKDLANLAVFLCYSLITISWSLYFFRFLFTEVLFPPCILPSLCIFSPSFPFTYLSFLEICPQFTCTMLSFFESAHPCPSFFLVFFCADNHVDSFLFILVFSVDMFFLEPLVQGE